MTTKTEAQLKALGIEYKTHEHPSAKTVAVMMEHIGNLGGGFCKNLFVKAKKAHPDRPNDSRLWLVVALVDAKVDLKGLTKALGYPPKGELRFADAEQLSSSLQCVQGEVTPFAVVNDPDMSVNVVLDKAMLEKDGLWFHPMTNEASTKISADALLKYIAHSGRTPVMMDFEKE
jgi:Ala-tRNA(Pro) deacylase